MEIEAHCGTCGWTAYYSQAEVDAEDVFDGQACPDCGIGPVRLTPPESAVDKLAKLGEDR